MGHVQDHEGRGSVSSVYMQGGYGACASRGGVQCLVLTAWGAGRAHKRPYLPVGHFWFLVVPVATCFTNFLIKASVRVRVRVCVQARVKVRVGVRGRARARATLRSTVRFPLQVGGESSTATDIGVRGPQLGSFTYSSIARGLYL